MVGNLKRGGGLNINQALLTELMIAGLNTPGFSESQRWELVQVSEYVGGAVKLSPLMKWWPWEALGRKAGSEEDVVEVCHIPFYRFRPFSHRFWKLRVVSVCVVPYISFKLSLFIPIAPVRTKLTPQPCPIQNYILIPRSHMQQIVLCLSIKISSYRKEGFSTSGRK